jgi:hypothetical protein
MADAGIRRPMVQIEIARSDPPPVSQPDGHLAPLQSARARASVDSG